MRVDKTDDFKAIRLISEHGGYMQTDNHDQHRNQIAPFEGESLCRKVIRNIENEQNHPFVYLSLGSSGIIMQLGLSLCLLEIRNDHR